MNRAIIAVSVGTTLAEADQNCIRPIEKALQHAFADWHVVRAFSSRIIRRRLQERGILINSPEEAAERLKKDGYRDIVFASTHLIPGSEYDALLSFAGKHKVSEPLLANEEDIRRLTSILSAIAEKEPNPLLLMGHGSDHAADDVYSCLKAALPENISLACLKGKHTLESLFPKLETLKTQKITLMPLMLVVGKHAQDALSETETSWKSILESRGFDVQVRAQGLGELPIIHQMIVEKVGKIIS